MLRNLVSRKLQGQLFTLKNQNLHPTKICIIWAPKNYFSTLAGQQSTLLQSTAIQILLKQIHQEAGRSDDDLIGIINHPNPQNFLTIKQNSYFSGDVGRLRLIYTGDSHADTYNSILRDHADSLTAIDSTDGLRANPEVWAELTTRQPGYLESEARLLHTVVHANLSRKNMICRYRN
jgi:hypothetical protein